MNLDEMNLDQVEKRLEELDAEVKEMRKVDDVDKASEEKKALLVRKAELFDLEERKKTALDLVADKVDPQIIDMRGDVKPMEFEKMAIDEVLATAEYRSAFLKRLQGKELGEVEQRAAVNGAAAIPTITWNKIVEKMEYIAPLYSKITTMAFASNMTIPVENATADASWVAMGTASTDSADSLGSISLAAYKLIKTIEIGADTKAMSIDAFESYIVDKLHKKVAKAVENAIINGTGSGQPTGLALAGQITNTGEYTLAGMTYDDLLTIISDLPDEGYRQNACFVMPSALFYSDVLPALTDKGSGLDVQAVTKHKVFEYDVILCDRLAADTLIFGDLSYYNWNWVSPVAIEKDDSVGFRTGSTVYRAMGLADGKLNNAAAFNLYTRASA